MPPFLPPFLPPAFLVSLATFATPLLRCGPGTVPQPFRVRAPARRSLDGGDATP